MNRCPHGVYSPHVVTSPYCTGCIAGIAPQIAIDRNPRVTKIAAGPIGGLWLYSSAVAESSEAPRKKEPARMDSQSGILPSKSAPQERAPRGMRRHSYITYLRFACSVKSAPLAPEQWEMLTANRVARHWERWEEYITKSKKLAVWTDAEDDRAAAWARYKRPHREEDARVRDAMFLGLFVGELQPDGSINVRRQTVPSEGAVLISRTCKVCRDYLPVRCFSKQEKSKRAVCKKCDNARRVQARREAK